MKIETKIQYYTLECICNLYDGVNEILATSPNEFQFTTEYRAAENVVNLLIVKFKTKLLKKSKDCKPFKVSLEYYQAYFLINFISANGSFFKGILERTLLQQFTEKIHQQL